MQESLRHTFARRVSALIIVVFTIAGSAYAGTLGRGMQQLVELYESNSPKLDNALKMHLTEKRNDVLVHVRVADGTTADQAVAQLAKTGFRLKAVSLLDPQLLEGYLPLSAARRASAISGVRTVLAVTRPFRSAGSVQSQAVAVQKADAAHARGIDGKGVKIGVLSDSYNGVQDHPNAADDVASGDLPPDVTVLEEIEDTSIASDEGRAMLQLVHDVAPGAKLGFASAFNGTVSFSNNILNLRRQFKADVIVDDVIYSDEPFFSDGLLAKTVDQVVSDGVAYYSSAGNNALEAYEHDYSSVSFADAKKLVKQGRENLDLEALKAHGLAPKSFHNFRNPDGSTSISQKFTSFFGDVVDFQWDEPFDLGKVKTDYNIFIFGPNGEFLDPDDPNSPILYSHDDNTETDQPAELLFVFVPGEYQVVIGKANNGKADHIKYVVINGAGESERQNAPNIWGHAAARKGQAVAAMYYPITKFPEDFSSPGPTTILFDQRGDRLRFPEIRFTPQVTGVDGADTTFFGGDVDGTGFPNFFGTSAAAPDVAAVAALVIQKAGGPGHISPFNVYRKIQDTATPMPLSIDRTLAATIAGPVWATAVGDFPLVDTYWRLTVEPFTHRKVKTVSIDLTNADMLWSNPASSSGFFVGKTSGLNPSDVTATRSADRATLTLTFADGKFGAGDFLSFANFAFPSQLPVLFQVDADRVQGAKVTVTLDDGSVRNGSFAVLPKLKVNSFTGAGLVNADLATR